MRHMIRYCIAILYILALVQSSYGVEGDYAILFGIDFSGEIIGPCTVEANKIGAKPSCGPDPINVPELLIPIPNGGTPNVGNFVVLIDNGYSGIAKISIVNKWQNIWGGPPTDIVVDNLEKQILGDLLCPNQGSTQTGYLFRCRYPKYVVSSNTKVGSYATDIEISFSINGHWTGPIPITAFVRTLSSTTPTTTPTIAVTIPPQPTNDTNATRKAIITGGSFDLSGFIILGICLTIIGILILRKK